MTQDEIIEMAKQAGWKDLRDYDSEMRNDIFMGSTSSFEAFAKLVAEKEREACAKAVEEYETDNDITATWLNIIADAIRARGQA